MCGIVGYSGERDSVPYLVNGLKRLEYRGYDSAGVAIKTDEGIKVVCAVGKVAALEEEISKDKPAGTIGIAHTRWATHGKPTCANAHPHTDCSGSIAVVHNGIMENYLEYKEKLTAKGHKFLSDTDTEVIAHLLEEILGDVQGDYEQALLKGVQELGSKLEGTYGLAIVWDKLPDVVMGIRKKSPLIAGIGEGENFLGSDISAFIEHTNKVIYINDGDIVVLKKDSVTLYDNDLQVKEVEIKELNVSSESVGKGEYKHYMRKEIYEQPLAIRNTIASVFSDINTAFGISADELKNIQNIMLIGCGTAYHATMVAKYWFEEFANIPTQAELASEYKYRKAAMPKDTLAVFVSQSGETADTVAALEKAQAAGFKSVAICNVESSTIARECDYTFTTKCGPEISVASTKAFTSQISALFALSVLVARAKGAIDEAAEHKLLQELNSIPVAVEDALLQEDTIVDISRKYYQSDRFIFLGRNANYPLALEGALKLKEISYINAEGFAAGEIKHGPIALVDEGMPVVSIMPADNLFDKMYNACEEVHARGARIIAITDTEGAKKLNKDYEDVIVLKQTPSYLFPLVNAVALQLLAYHVADMNDREIDQPRNLAKSVTVE